MCKGKGMSITFVINGTFYHIVLHPDNMGISLQGIPGADPGIFKNKIW